MANPQTVHTRPKFLNANTLVHGAWDIRPSDYGVPPGPGVAGYEDFRVMQRQAGATMDVDVGKTGVGLMKAWVQGTTRTGQGLYECDNIDWTAPTASTYLAQLAVTVSANASGNPRLDMVVLEVLDQQHTGASSLLQLRVVTGTATGGATLDNRTGAAALPASCILLADILVPNGAASITTADIRDRRAFPLPGVVPPLLTDVDAVAFIPGPGLGPTLSIDTTQLVAYGGEYAHNTHDTHQVAALMCLPRRIAAATRIRWRYGQGTTANTGNYIIGIYDASGRQIVTTGSVAFAGAANSIQERSEAITATTLEAGSYYVFAGWDSGTVGGFSRFPGINVATAAGTAVSVQMRNTALRAASGGVTAPSTLLGLTDVASLTATTAAPGVPLIALSVG